MNSRVNIKIKRTADYVDKIDVNGRTFLIQTEYLGAKIGKIVTKTYQDGAIVNSVSTDYSNPAAGPSAEERIRELMDRLHGTALKSCSEKTQEKRKSKALLAEEMKICLAKGNKKGALKAAREALEFFPEDPFFLSYSGYLMAIVERKKREGCTICEESVRVMSKTSSEDKGFFYPILYLNLGKAYLTCNQKKAALDALREGIKYDSKNQELQSQIDRLGRRRDPVIPFLPRRHFINKYLGIIRHKMQTA